jgi:hypothetical protein
MRGTTAVETVTLHYTRKSLPYGRTLYINFLSNVEDIHLNLGARLKIFTLARRQTKFPETTPRFDASLSKMSGGWLVHSSRTACASGDLYRTVAIAVLVLHLCNAIDSHFEYRHGHSRAVLREHAGHAQFSPDHTYRHVDSL